MTLLLVLLLWAPPRPSFLADSVAYLSPINPELHISSTFAETRASHFHAAIDYGTLGKTGYPVYASRAGVVHRILISPLGYGLAIYLKHPDGSFTQYSHLKSFSKKIASAIDSIRLSEGIYLFDRVVDSLGIRVAAGEVIALSGDTGAGPPHLHFEIRSPDNRAINPFLVGFGMPDKVPPQFHGIAFEPLSIRSKIRGRRQIRTAGVQADGSEFRFETETVQGPVGLAVRVSDRSDNLRNVFAVYRLQLRVNGQLVFTSQVDSFDIADHGMMRLDRIYPLLVRNRRMAYQRLHVQEGNTTPFYTTSGNGGKLDLPAGRHAIEVIAEDFAGNRSVLTGTVLVQNASQDPDSGVRVASVPIKPDSTGGGVRTIGNLLEPYHNFVVFRQPIDSLWVGNPPVYFASVPAGYALDVTGDRTVGRTTLYRLYPDEPRRLTTPDGRMLLIVPRNAVYDTLSAAFGYWLDTDGLRLMVWQPLEPFRRAIRIGFEHPGDAFAGLYSQSNRFLGALSMDGYLTASITEPGVYKILSDSLPPVVSAPRISRRGSEWILSLTVQDNRSGIDWASAKIWINGRLGMPETTMGSRLTYVYPGWRPAATNEVRVRIDDRMGNRADVRFTVPRP
jgi:hypothetical protein